MCCSVSLGYTHTHPFCRAKAALIRRPNSLIEMDKAVATLWLSSRYHRQTEQGWCQVPVKQRGATPDWHLYKPSDERTDKLQAAADCCLQLQLG